MHNVICLDLETARSADDCFYCGKEEATHIPIAGGLLCHPNPHPDGSTFTPIGWGNKPALGLSIGCYYDYADQRVHWFDEHTVADTMVVLVQRQPLMVSYNGRNFDFPLMRGLVRRQAETMPLEDAQALIALCDDFKVLCARSYDILAEIWAVDPAGKFVRGLNSLDALAQANGLGGKTGHGAQAPRNWAAGRWAQVLNYCSFDVYLTKALFEMILAGKPLTRSNGILLALRLPIAHADYSLEAL